MSKRDDKIKERLDEVPTKYKEMYRKAVKGNSRKAAMHAHCAECCGWQIKEVYLCTDLACSLYPYRPQSTSS